MNTALLAGVTSGASGDGTRVQSVPSTAATRAHKHAWLLLILGTISVSPASIIVVGGALLTLHRLASHSVLKATTSHASSDEQHDVVVKLASSARLWYISGALVALSTFVVALVLWVLDVAHGLLGDSALEPIVHWLALCSAVLATACVWVLSQRRKDVAVAAAAAGAS